MIEKKLIDRIVRDYALRIYGIHGIGHWARVLENGQKLSSKTGADLKVVLLFAVLHDSKRQNEGKDMEHGVKASLFLNTIRDEYLNITDDQCVILSNACSFHNQALINPKSFYLSNDSELALKKACITIQTCWDADRLDLGRVGTIVDSRKLCTEAAKKSEIIQWGSKRAREELLPEFALLNWSQG